MKEWKDSYLVGIELIDVQHKHLFDLGNSLLTLMKNNSYLNNPDEIIQLIDDIIQHTKHYFSTEEAYMLEIEYPLYNNHKDEHDALIQKITQIDLKTFSPSQYDCFQDLIIFLLNWLVVHIIEMDKLIPNE